MEDNAHDVREVHRCVSGRGCAGDDGCVCVRLRDGEFLACPRKGAQEATGWLPLGERFHFPLLYLHF